MKKALILMTLLISNVAFADTFCREIRGGGFGAPAGSVVSQHCVSLERGFLTDNGNTFFGNPPETSPFRLVGLNVQVRQGGRWTTVYEISRDGTQLRNSAGAVLNQIK